MISLLTDDDPRRHTVLVTLLGLDSVRRAEVVKTFAADLQAENETPVFVTDDLDFRIFASAGYFYEYLPPRDMRLRYDAKRRWDLYMVRRLQIILEKWKPARVTDCGLSLEALILSLQPKPSVATQFDDL